ncbi:hypothetical protein Hanom_Chr00s201329g01837981 [Helianthus anomalus]
MFHLIRIFNFFLNGQQILQTGYLRNSPHRDTLGFRTGKNPHLGPKPVNTRPKARQCGEVKPRSVQGSN